MEKTALVVGANGLVGSQLLFQLLNDSRYQQVITLVRRSMHLKHPKLDERLVDFDALSKTDWQADDIYCCLGTTIRTAGSQEAFRKVDFTYPLEVAKLGLERGTKQFLIVTALGSDAVSSIFYSRVKGEIENAIKGLPYETIHIFRPSMLLGDRKETRIGESIAKVVTKVIGPLMLGPLKKYKGIYDAQVAAAMRAMAEQSQKGVFIHESDEMQAYQSPNKRPAFPRV
ncbi:MAG: NAD-dependent epimerase/dehydratase family protein [Spirosomataceae bacterium]